MLQKCCCLSLKTGGIIVGWIDVVGSVCAILFYIYVISNREELMDEAINRSPEQSKQSMEETRALGLTILTIIASSQIVFFVAKGIAAGVLLVGIKKIRPKLMLAWLIVNAISFGFSSLVILIVFLKNPSLILQVSTLVAVAVLGLAAYLYCVIYSLYKEMRMEGERKGERGHVEFQGVSRT